MTEVRLDVAFAHPVDRVWRAVTDRRLLSEWFMPIVADPDDDNRFTLHPRRLDGFSGPLQGEILERNRPHRMVMRWHTDDLHVRVILMIEATAEGCRLTFVQRGFLGPKGTLRRRVLRGTYQRLLTESLLPALDWLAANDTLGAAPGGNLAPALRRTPAGGGKARRNDGGFRARRAPSPRSGSDSGDTLDGEPKAPTDGPVDASDQLVAEPGEPEPAPVQPAPAMRHPARTGTAGSASVKAPVPAARVAETGPPPDHRAAAVRDRGAVPPAPRVDQAGRIVDPGPPRTRRAARQRRDYRQLVRRSSAAPPPRATRPSEPGPAVVREVAAQLRGVREWNPEQRSRAMVSSGVLLLLVALGLVMVAWIGGTAEGVRPQSAGDLKSSAPAQMPAAQMPAGQVPAGQLAATPVSSAPVSSAPVASAVAAQPRGLTGTYRTAESWAGGYRVEVTLANPGPGEIRGWTVIVTLPGRVFVLGPVHGAVYRQSGQILTFTPIEATREVDPNEFVQFDFLLTGSAKVAGCSVDGRSCEPIPGRDGSRDRLR